MAAKTLSVMVAASGDEVHHRESLREPGVATVSPIWHRAYNNVSQPHGATHFGNVGDGGGDPRSMVVCLASRYTTKSNWAAANTGHCGPNAFEDV